MTHTIDSFKRRVAEKNGGLFISEMPCTKYYAKKAIKELGLEPVGKARVSLPNKGWVWLDAYDFEKIRVWLSNYMSKKLLKDTIEL